MEFSAKDYFTADDFDFVLGPDDEEELDLEDAPPSELLLENKTSEVKSINFSAKDFFAGENMDELFDFFEQVLEEEDLTKTFDDDILGIDAAAVLDILGTGQHEVFKVSENFTRKQVDKCDVGISASKKLKTLTDHGLRIGPEGLKLFTRPPYVYMGPTYTNVIKVGKCKLNVQFERTLQATDPLILASHYNEDCIGKGSGLGFSLFTHSAALLLIAQRDDVLEPIEGYDLWTSGSTIEVTGANYETRVSEADIIINKYSVLQFFLNHSPDLPDVIKFAYAEDHYDNSFLDSSSIDQGDSEYSPLLQEMQLLHRQLSTIQRKMIGNQLLSWVSRRPFVNYQPPVPDYSINYFYVVNKWSKEIGGVKLLPAPFRVLVGKAEDDLQFMTQLRINPLEYAPDTTFHTLKVTEDPVKYFFHYSDETIENLFPFGNGFMTQCFNEIMKYDIFRSIYVESEMYGKISGKNGCFFSKYTHTGIAWRACRANSLNYYVCFYQQHLPPISCGRWGMDKSGIYRSPVIKVSLNDIAYAKVLPYKVTSMLVSMFAYTTAKQRPYIFQRLMIIASIMRWSTWQTSALLGDFRFITLCAISKTGNVPLLINKIYDRVHNFLSFPDYMVLRITKGYEANAPSFDGQTTPFLGLPLRFIALEKDMALLTMWHLRSKQHETNCFNKLYEGVVDEVQNRIALLGAYKYQTKYLRKLIDKGRTQNDFDAMMCVMPDIPYFNYIVFIGLCNFAAKTMTVSERNARPSVTLKDLITDHHGTFIDTKTTAQIVKINNIRVADGVEMILNEYHKPPGIHQLITRMSKGKKILNMYTIHPKDAKSKDREIPQMTSHMRVFQYVSETLIGVYTELEAIDMMQNPNKYNLFVTEFSRIMQLGGITRSEDKSFFSGHMHPECMALAVHALAVEVGSPALVLSSAILRCDKSRYTVVPEGFHVDDSITQIPVYLQVQRKTERRIAIRNYIHFMQGVRAMAGALVNTVFCKGLDVIQRILSPDISITSVMTTSDDSARGVYVNNKISSHVEQMMDYINLPVTLVKHCMMKDSEDKAIVSSKLAEFNNVVVGPSGMFPQQFVHPSLAIQPLNGETIIDDILSVVSAARMSITWGDSPDVMRSVYEANLILLQQRWLFTHHQIEYLEDIGLLPICDEDILAGNICPSQALASRIIAIMTPNEIDELMAGQFNLLSVLRRFKFKRSSKTPSIRKTHYKTDSIQLDLAFKLINKSRYVRQRKAVKYIRPPKYHDRIIVRDQFMNFVTNAKVASDEIFERIRDVLPNKFEMIIVHHIPRRSHMMPCYQGIKTKNYVEIDVSKILTFHYFKLFLYGPLTKDEMDIATLPREELLEKLKSYKEKQSFLGLSFKSASGLPLMYFHNDHMFNRPVAFQLVIDLEPTAEQKPTFSYNGSIVPNFKPCLYGQASFIKCKTEMLIPAFGYSIEGDNIHIFYRRRSERVKSMTIRKTKFPYVIVDDNIGKIYCPLAIDYTPLDVSYFGITRPYIHEPSLVGDSRAAINYGNFYHTNANQANVTLSELFNSLGAVLPKIVHRFKSEYPKFLKNAVVIDMAASNTLIGVNCIHKLKLKPVKNPLAHQAIDLNGIEPKIVKEPKYNVGENWADYELDEDE